jgi:hypothetical protein
MPCVHVRLISLTYVPSDPTLNIWRSDVDRDAPGRGKRWDSSLWTHGIIDVWWEVLDRHAVPVQKVIIHSGTWQLSWAPGSTIRRVMHDDDLEHPAHEQEARHTMMFDFEFPQSLKNSATTYSSGGHTTSYDRPDRWSDTTTDRDFIDDYPIIRVSSHWDPNNEAWRISNQEAINSSNKYSMTNKSTMIKYGSSSSSHTLLQQSLTAGVNLRDISGLMLQNWCALSDQQAMCHHLRRNLFKSN